MLYRHVGRHSIEPPTALVGRVVFNGQSRSKPHVAMIDPTLSRCTASCTGTNTADASRLALLECLAANQDTATSCILSQKTKTGLVFASHVSECPLPTDLRTTCMRALCPTASVMRQDLTCAETKLWFMNMVHLRRNIRDALPKRL